MTNRELLRLFPNASADVIAANAAADPECVDRSPTVDIIKESTAMSVDEVWQEYLSTGSIHRAATKFGLSGDTLRRFLLKNGVRLKRSAWTPEDERVIRDGYATSGPIDMLLMGKLLGRTYAAIACKAEELGLTTERGERGRTEEHNAQIAAATTRRARSPEGREEMRQMALRNIRDNGHPRGFLGRSHSKESREAISKAQAGKIIPPACIEKQIQTKRERYGGLIAPAIKQGSWKARWVIVGGKRIFTRSLWETNYAHYLEFQKSIGEIIEWEYEPKTFWFEGIKRGVRSYLPDFRVTLKSGLVEWHEVKGWMDSRSKTKLKRMKKYHPQEVVRVLDGAWFKRANLQFLGIVPGWETTRRSKSTKK